MSYKDGGFLPPGDVPGQSSLFDMGGSSAAGGQETGSGTDGRLPGGPRGASQPRRAQVMQGAAEPAESNRGGGPGMPPPLAHRMRPRTLDEFIGQEHIVGPGRLLRRAIEADRVPNLIFHGPPGCGKTTLAEIIALTTEAPFQRLNAVTAGVADLRKVVAAARQYRRSRGRPTIVFIDEIHRFNKAQQDALLPTVEDGTITLIGATTENPFFSVNAPLVSRSRLFAFEPLTDHQVKELLRRAAAEDGTLGAMDLEIDEEALDHWARVAAGDVRSALGALELAVATTPPDEAGRLRITLETAVESIQQRALVYDRDGDGHYDTVSAFIKSMRGSDPDAAVYWLARMLEAGEDPMFIARRIVVHAAEDVGLADPQALVVATSAARGLELVGLPEGRLLLAQAALYVAAAPKSNAVYAAIDKARDDVRNKRAGGVPIHLKDASYAGARRLGHGRGYKYPHSYPGGYVEQQYLPAGVSPGVYYKPTDRGAEACIKKRLEELRKPPVDT